MKIILKILCSVVLLTLLSCIKTQKSKHKLEFWEKIKTAVLNEDLTYLLSISKDTLKCIECEEGKSKTSKEEFFKLYIGQMQDIKGQEYVVSTDTIQNELIRHRVTYQKSYKGNDYSIIYTLIENKEVVSFLGVESVP